MLLPPNQPAAFESLCLDLWSEIWGDVNAQKNGRNGHPQAGVDVFGRSGGRWLGVQCKQRDGLLWSKVRTAELTSEVEKAKTFTPALTEFTLATSGPASYQLQERARTLTKDHLEKGLFAVNVWSWEKIWHELYGRPTLLNRIRSVYWPHLGSSIISVFDGYIKEAEDMIRRYRVCTLNGGVFKTPEPDRVRTSESDSWFAGTTGTVAAVFGNDSNELLEWGKLAARIGEFVDIAIMRDWGACEGYTNHLNLCIGLLNSFRAQERILEKRGQDKP